jgi:hypothetical protein
MYGLGMPVSPAPPCKDATNCAALLYMPPCDCASARHSAATPRWTSSIARSYSASPATPSSAPYCSLAFSNSCMATMARPMPRPMSGPVRGAAAEDGGEVAGGDAAAASTTSSGDWSTMVRVAEGESQ